MERAGTPIPTSSQVQNSVKNTNNELKSTTTLVNVSMSNVSDHVDLNRIKLKEVHSFGNNKLKALHTLKKDKNAVTETKNSDKDLYITVQKALTIGKKIDVHYKAIKQGQGISYNKSVLLRDSYFKKKSKLKKLIAVGLTTVHEISHKNQSKMLSFHKNGAAVVKIVISDSFTWSKTNQNMYSYIEKNPELITNLSEKQLGFLQECFEKVCVCSAEISHRKSTENSLSGDSDNGFSKKIVKNNLISDSEINNKLYGYSDETNSNSEILSSTSKNILDLKNNVEDFSQLDNSSYSSYLDFDDISKLPEMLLLNMLKENDEDFINEKPFIEQIFERKITYPTDILDCSDASSENITNPNLLSLSKHKASKQSLIESCNSTSLSSHSTSKAQNIKQKRSKQVVDQMFVVKPSYPSRNLFDDLF